MSLRCKINQLERRRQWGFFDYMSHTHRGITNLVRMQSLGTVGQRAVAIGNVILAVVSRSLRIIHEQKLLDLALKTHIYHSCWLGNIHVYWCNSGDQREIKPHLTLCNWRTYRCKAEKSFKMKNNLCNTDEIRVKLVEWILFAYSITFWSLCNRKNNLSSFQKISFHNFLTSLSPTAPLSVDISQFFTFILLFYLFLPGIASVWERLHSLPCFPDACELR